MVIMLGCLPCDRGSNPLCLAKYGYVAQLVEHEIENLGVGGSIPPVSTKYAMVAQQVEQRIENPCVTGSIPVRSTSFIKYGVLV